MAKSDNYQYKFYEFPTDTKYLNGYHNSKACFYDFNSNTIEQRQLIDEIEELRLEMFNLLISIATPKLTETQEKYLTLYLDGIKVIDIAKICGVMQCSVHFSMYGEPRYKSWNGGELESPIHHGGIIKKLQKIAKASPEIQEMLKEIRDLENICYG